MPSQPTSPENTHPSFITTPTIPLTRELRDAYQDLYDTNEAAIQASNDLAVLEALAPSQTNIRNVLTKDNIYRVEQTTALLKALIDQINDTNDELASLKLKIAAIATRIATAGTIITAIDKVLTLSGV